MKKCRVCEYVCPDEMNFCEQCGNNTFDTIVESPKVEAKDEPVIFCPNCGKQNPVTGAFCESCGTNLQERVIDTIDERSNVEDIKEEVYEGPIEKVEPVSESVIFCPACGNKNAGDTIFCESCGHKVSDPVVEVPVENSAVNQTVPRPPRKPLSKKNKVGIASGLIVLGLVVGGYNYGQYYYSGEKEISRFIQAIKDKDADEAANYLVSEDPTVKIDKKTVKPLINYFDTNKDELKALNAALLNQNEYYGMKFYQTGKQFGFFDKHQAKIETVYANLKTNKENVDLYMNDKKLITSDTDEFTKKVGPLLPGLYNFKADMKDEKKKEAKVEETLSLSPDMDSHDINLSFKIIKARLTSNVEVADVKVNDKKVGELNGEGEFIYGPVLYTPGLTFKLTTKLGDKEIESFEYKVGNEEFSEDSFDDYSNTAYLSFDLDGEDLWDTSKLERLDNRMSSWGRTMGQDYKRYGKEESFKWDGKNLKPSDLSGKGKVVVGGTEETIEMLPLAESKDKLNVIAVYSDVEDTDLKSHHLYLFTIKNGKKKVLVTEGKADDKGKYQFKETGNEDLRELFDEL